jgi:alpha-galactosidase
VRTLTGILAGLVLIASAVAANEQGFITRWGWGTFGAAGKNEEAQLGSATFQSDAIPFSFFYDGTPSRDLLPNWKRRVEEPVSVPGGQRQVVIYTDPTSGLEIRCEATVFADYPAIEWVLRLKNGGTADTPILDDIRPLDVSFRVPSGDVVLHHSYGSAQEVTDYLPRDSVIPPGRVVTLGPKEGRSSDGALPFFNLQWSGGGLVAAIGWSGQWAFRLARDDKDGVTLQAGQELTHLRLHPGESIRTPSILFLAWEGSDRLRGHNLFRRLLLAHYAPRVNGEVAVPPVSQMSFFTLNNGNDVSEANQLASLPPMAAWDVEAYWLDAGWFEKGYPAGVGTWVPSADRFPRGIKPLADATHHLGMKFILWFEPERVKPASQLGREHPEWVLHGGDYVQRPDELGLRGSLFNLGDPAARQWMTDHLSRCVREWDVDIYRNDFNIAPLAYWRAADAPDRKGITEIRYIEGLYQMWDDLRASKPGLLIDNCASGGRRIDLEMMRRSYVLWRSDTPADRPLPVQDQVQSAGFSLYYPLHASAAWEFDAYTFRSVATTGVTLCMNTHKREFPLDQARKAIAEVKALRPFMLGDYYPLSEINLDERAWCAWQYNRPDLKAGFALCFRRARNPEHRFVARLHGLEPDANYRVTVEDRAPVTMRGTELAALSVELPSPESSALIAYRQVDK